MENCGDSRGFGFIYIYIYLYREREREREREISWGNYTLSTCDLPEKHFAYWLIWDEYDC